MHPNPYEQPHDMEPLTEFFDYEHLPPHLQAVSKPFGEMSKHLRSTLQPSLERSVALRKLLEAKDAAVRARLLTPDE